VDVDVDVDVDEHAVFCNIQSLVCKYSGYHFYI